MIYECNCQHEFQDRVYGKNRRVFNAMGANGKSGIRCSVCGKENKSVVAKTEKSDKSTKGKSNG